MLDEAISDQASIDENVDRVAVELLNLRLGDEAVDAEFAWISRPRIFLRFTAPRWWLRQPDMRERLHGGHREQLVQSVFAENLIDTLAAASHRRCDQHGVRG